MEENLAFPLKKIQVKMNSLNSLWIFKKDLKSIPKSIKSGDFVEIYTEENNFLGIGYINIDSKIPIRIISKNKINITKNFIKEKIKESYNKRKILLQNKITSFRIVHSEADFLPGVIIDKYNNIFSIQINTAGMENLRPWIINAIKELFNPISIYEKSDKNLREKEGLLNKNGLIYGEDIDSIKILENNTEFLINFSKSQKTGFYLDQRKNREIISKFANNKRILDLFCHTGGFGIKCAQNGANLIKFVEISKDAILILKENIKINNIKNYEIINENVFKFMEKEKEKYDIIIIDPPAFAKSKKDKKNALKAYKFLISSAIKILNNNGLIAIFSCSHHIETDDLIKLIQDIALKENKYPEIIDFLYQDFRDHPYILTIPNSLYLKGILFKI